jgi:hypothetical protein
MGETMQRLEDNLTRALRSLENRGIRVVGPAYSPHGFVFEVMGFMLTESQVLELQEAGNLYSWGIREFANRIGQETRDGEHSP